MSWSDGMLFPCCSSFTKTWSHFHERNCHHNLRHVWRCDIFRRQLRECRWFRCWRWMFIRPGKMLLLYNQSVITVMRANSCFFCLLCCSVQKTGQSFTASSFLTLTQLGEQGREKKTEKPVLLPHSHRKCIIMFSICKWKDLMIERLLSSVVSKLVVIIMAFKFKLNS